MVGLTMSEYFALPVVINSYVDYSQSRILPNSTICLPLDYGELDESRSLEKQPKRLVTALEYLHKQNWSKNDFITKDRRWNNAVRNAVHAYLIDLSNCEAGIHAKCNQNYTNDDDLNIALNILEKMISKLNITVDELRQGFGYEVAEYYAFYIALYEFGAYISYVIDIIHTKFIGVNQICYEMPFSLRPISITNNFHIGLVQHNLPNRKNVGINGKMITIAFVDRLFNDISNADIFYQVSFGQEVIMPLELIRYNRISKMNDDTQRCGEQTIYQCEATCRIKFILEHCKCVPTSWPNLLEYINKVCLFFYKFNFNF